MVQFPPPNQVNKQYRIFSNPNEKGIRVSDSRWSWLGRSIKYQGTDHQNYFLNRTSAKAYLKRHGIKTSHFSDSKILKKIAELNSLKIEEKLSEVQKSPIIRENKTLPVSEKTITKDAQKDAQEKLDVTQFLNRAESYYDTLPRNPMSPVELTLRYKKTFLDYVAKKLNDPQFQKDPVKFMDGWEKVESDIFIPNSYTDNQARIFFEKEVMPNISNS